MEKTNVMRILDQKKIPHKEYSYPCDEAISGMEIARVQGQNPDQDFKTLVTVAASKKNYVFVVPAPHELDLKKAAKAVGEVKGAAANYRIYSRRLLANRYEKVLYNSN